LNAVPHAVPRREVPDVPAGGDLTDSLRAPIARRTTQRRFSPRSSGASNSRRFPPADAALGDLSTVFSAKSPFDTDDPDEDRRDVDVRSRVGRLLTICR
jgi:hypothetical protein